MAFFRVNRIFFIACAAILSGCGPSHEVRSDFKKYYDSFDVEGSFVLYDQNADHYTYFNPDQSTEGFTPVSTFKICNALIGLETGVIPNENFVLPWDSVVRQVAAWNTNSTLKEAFQHSTVWYFQELARRVGGERMCYWLHKVPFGNADTSGGIDKFWLNGGLRVSPMQQIEFLKQLHNNQLPFSQRSQSIVKEIMIEKDTLDFVIRAKSGWGALQDRDIGWYVGYIETKDNVIYFSNCIQTSDPNNRAFAKARKAIAYEIMEELGQTYP